QNHALVTRRPLPKRVQRAAPHLAEPVRALANEQTDSVVPVVPDLAGVLRTEFEDQHRLVAIDQRDGAGHHLPVVPLHVDLDQTQTVEPLRAYERIEGDQRLLDWCSGVEMAELCET